MCSKMQRCGLGPLGIEMMIVFRRCYSRTMLELLTLGAPIAVIFIKTEDIRYAQAGTYLSRSRLTTTGIIARLCSAVGAERRGVVEAGQWMWAATDIGR